MKGYLRRIFRYSFCLNSYMKAVILFSALSFSAFLCILSNLMARRSIGDIYGISLVSIISFGLESSFALIFKVSGFSSASLFTNLINFLSPCAQQTMPLVFLFPNLPYSMPLKLILLVSIIQLKHIKKIFAIIFMRKVRRLI